MRQTTRPRTPPPEAGRPGRVRFALIAGPAAVIVIGAAAACASSPGPPAAQQTAAGSAVVPCSVIAGQVRYLAQFVTIRAGAPGWPGDLYAREQKLAGMFSNVSNADQPLALSAAEVDYELAVNDTPAGVGTQFPVTGEVASAFGELANSCGIPD